LEPANNNAKKDIKKTQQDAQEPLICNGDKPRPRENEFLTDDKSLRRPVTERFVNGTQPGVISSPKTNKKGQNLKAILESIQPLRQCGDNKMLKEKVVNDISCQVAVTSTKVLKDNKENNRYVIKSVQDKEVSTDETQVVNKYGVSSNQSTAHTQTRLQICDFAKIKQEPPDDFWSMKMNYLEKRPLSNHAMELRIKPESHSGQQDDRSQTFRISCSRPDAANNSSSALHRNMKPDIVLKVRPRSTSVPNGIVNRSVPQEIMNSRPVNTYKTVSRFHGRLEPQTTIFSAVSRLGVKTRPVLQPGQKGPKVLYAGSVRPPLPPPPPPQSIQHPRYSSHTSNFQQTSVMLQTDSCGAANSQVLNHNDVLEESKLPPVANTVELLSEPHEYPNGSSDRTTCIYKISDYPQSLANGIAASTTVTSSSGSMQHLVNYAIRQTQTPCIAQQPVVKSVQPEPRYEEPDSTTGWSLESSLCLKQGDPMLWRDFDLDQDHMHHVRHHYDDNEEDDITGSSGNSDVGMLGSCSLPNLVKEESEEDRCRVENMQRRALAAQGTLITGAYRRESAQSLGRGTSAACTNSNPSLYPQISRKCTPAGPANNATPQRSTYNTVYLPFPTKVTVYFCCALQQYIGYRFLRNWNLLSPPPPHLIPTTTTTTKRFC
jgi:hypothetical protein